MIKKTSENIGDILQEAIYDFPDLNPAEIDKLAMFLGRAYAAGLIEGVNDLYRDVNEKSN